ncbi:hypothetical protein HDU96_009456 [Phlyctochytrium bullatum]|nr:hypothetical protein HDU96_009456 [Phlyctochytrium bullatum]
MKNIFQRKRNNGAGSGSSSAASSSSSLEVPSSPQNQGRRARSLGRTANQGSSSPPQQQPTPPAEGPEEEIAQQQQGGERTRRGPKWFKFGRKKRRDQPQLTVQQELQIQQTPHQRQQQQQILQEQRRLQEERQLAQPPPAFGGAADGADAATGSASNLNGATISLIPLVSPHIYWRLGPASSTPLPKFRRTFPNEILLHLMHLLDHYPTLLSLSLINREFRSLAEPYIRAFLPIYAPPRLASIIKSPPAWLKHVKYLRLADPLGDRALRPLVDLLPNLRNVTYQDGDWGVQMGVGVKLACRNKFESMVLDKELEEFVLTVVESLAPRAGGSPSPQDESPEDGATASPPAADDEEDEEAAEAEHRRRVVSSLTATFGTHITSILVDVTFNGNPSILFDSLPSLRKIHNIHLSDAESFLRVVAPRSWTPRIEELSMRLGFDLDTVRWDRFDQVATKSFPNLKKLKLDLFYLVLPLVDLSRNVALEHLFAKCPALEHLEVTGAGGYINQALMDLIKTAFPKLKGLALGPIGHSGSAAAIASALVELEQLDSLSLEVTDAEFTELFASPSEETSDLSTSPNAPTDSAPTDPANANPDTTTPAFTGLPLLLPCLSRLTHFRLVLSSQEPDPPADGVTPPRPPFWPSDLAPVLRALTRVQVLALKWQDRDGWRVRGALEYDVRSAMDRLAVPAGGEHPPPPNPPVHPVLEVVAHHASPTLRWLRLPRSLSCPVPSRAALAALADFLGLYPLPPAALMATMVVPAAAPAAPATAGRPPPPPPLPQRWIDTPDVRRAAADRSGTLDARFPCLEGIGVSWRFRADAWQASGDPRGFARDWEALKKLALMRGVLFCMPPWEQWRYKSSWEASD